MPELPETETIARDLHGAIAGARVIAATVLRADVLREIAENDLNDAVAGRAISRVWRRAKLVVLDLVTPNGGRTRNNMRSANAIDDTRDPVHIVVQPRFTGALLLDDGTLPRDQLDYLTVSFSLADGRHLHYRDVRRLGTLSLMSSDRFAGYAGALGPEPLDAEFTNADFSALVRASRRPIKTLLMDQARLAGVGNIYANEALWLAGIDPSRIANTLDDNEACDLLATLRTVLRASIEARGTSFRDYRDARGQRGAYVQQLAVYGRGGEPCQRCRRRLVDTHAVDGRTTVFCAHCQR